MKAADLVRAVREAGIEMEWRGGKIWLRPRSRVTNEIEVWMAQHRQVIIWALQRRLPGNPLNEIWLRPRDWQRWMEMCGEGVERRRSYDEAA